MTDKSPITSFRPGDRVRLTQAYDCDIMVVGDLTIPAGALGTVLWIDELNGVAIAPDDRFPILAGWCEGEDCEYQLQIMTDDGRVPLALAGVYQVKIGRRLVGSFPSESLALGFISLELAALNWDFLRARVIEVQS